VPHVCSARVGHSIPLVCALALQSCPAYLDIEWRREEFKTADMDKILPSCFWRGPQCQNELPLAVTVLTEVLQVILHAGVSKGSIPTDGYLTWVGGEVAVVIPLDEHPG
jgi:hypothetical protein